MNLVRTIIIGSLSILCAASVNTIAMAQDYTPLAAERQAEIAQGIYHCNVEEIAVFPGRMHVTCGRYDGIYFSLALTDEPMVSHVMDMARFSIAHDENELLIRVNPNRGDNPAGCQQNDCYRIQSAQLRPSVWN